MGKKVRRSLHNIIGRREVELLTLQVHTLFLGAYASSGQALGHGEIEVKVDDARAMAAALILIASGHLVQTDYNGSQRFFKATDSGKQAVRRFVHSGRV